MVPLYLADPGYSLKVIGRSSRNAAHNETAISQSMAPNNEKLCFLWLSQACNNLLQSNGTWRENLGVFVERLQIKFTPNRFLQSVCDWLRVWVRGVGVEIVMTTQNKYPAKRRFQSQTSP